MGMKEVQRESAWWSEQGVGSSYFGRNGLSQRLHLSDMDVSSKSRDASSTAPLFLQDEGKSFDRVHSVPDFFSPAPVRSTSRDLPFASAPLRGSAYPRLGMPAPVYSFSLGDRPSKALRASAEANGAGRLPDPQLEERPLPSSKDVRIDAYPDWMMGEVDGKLTQLNSTTELTNRSYTSSESGSSRSSIASGIYSSSESTPVGSTIFNPGPGNTMAPAERMLNVEQSSKEADPSPVVKEIKEEQGNSISSGGKVIAKEAPGPNSKKTAKSAGRRSVFQR